MAEGFVDIHCHLLPGVDDGSKDMAMTRQLLQMSYDEGIRDIVFTPHARRPYLMKTSISEIRDAYARVKEEAASVFPDLGLHLAAEVYYSHEVFEDYPERCLTYGDTDCMLLEFSPQTPWSDVVRGSESVMAMGYQPIIAHIERYHCLVEDVKRVEQLCDMGMLMQINTDTVTDPPDFRTKRFLKRVLKEGLIFFAATDAHQVGWREPKMRDAWMRIAKKFGEEYADNLFALNPRDMLCGRL